MIHWHLTPASRLAWRIVYGPRCGNELNVARAWRCVLPPTARLWVFVTICCGTLTWCTWLTLVWRAWIYIAWATAANGNMSTHAVRISRIPFSTRFSWKTSKAICASSWFICRSTMAWTGWKWALKRMPQLASRFSTTHWLTSRLCSTAQASCRVAVQPVLACAAQTLSNATWAWSAWILASAARERWIFAWQGQWQE